MHLDQRKAKYNKAKGTKKRNVYEIFALCAQISSQINERTHTRIHIYRHIYKLLCSLGHLHNIITDASHTLAEYSQKNVKQITQADVWRVCVNVGLSGSLSTHMCANA